MFFFNCKMFHHFYKRLKYTTNGNINKKTGRNFIIVLRFSVDIFKRRSQAIVQEQTNQPIFK